MRHIETFVCVFLIFKNIPMFHWHSYSHLRFVLYICNYELYAKSICRTKMAISQISYYIINVISLRKLHDSNVSDKNFGSFSLLQLRVSLFVRWVIQIMEVYRRKINTRWVPRANGANTIKISEYHAHEGQRTQPNMGQRTASYIRYLHTFRPLFCRFSGHTRDGLRW